MNETYQDLEEAAKQGIDLDGLYGLDGQYINFKPKCSSPVNRGDVIVQGDITLYCVEPNVFAIYDKNKIDFVRGYQLLKEFNKLEL